MFNFKELERQFDNRYSCDTDEPSDVEFDELEIVQMIVDRDGQDVEEQLDELPDITLWAFEKVGALDLEFIFGFERAKSIRKHGRKVAESYYDKTSIL